MYALAKILFPKLRPDERVKRLNTIVFVLLISVVSGGLVAAILLTRYSQIGK